jgi:hypothetical protein
LARAAAVVAVMGLGSTAQAIELQLIADSGPLVSAEIVAFDSSTSRVFSTYTNGINIFDFDGSNLSFVSNIIAPLNTTVSSVALDPLGRGFGAFTVIPNASTSTLGKVVLFNATTGSPVHVIDVGYHPDMVTFSADGNHLLIANEGEPVALTNALAGLGDQNGSISVINTSAATLANLNTLTASTFDFSAPNLAGGVDLSTIRIDPVLYPTAADKPRGIEPEYITVADGKAYVSLQEANAIGVFDLGTSQWTAVNSLGVINQLIDASDRDLDGTNGKIAIDDNVNGLPMPDAIASYSYLGQTFIVTANEGDTREYIYNEGIPGETVVYTDADRFRNIDDVTNNGGGDIVSVAGSGDNQILGRLTVSKIDGNLDADALIETPYMFGTRSFSIFDINGNLIWDSGSFLEQYIATNHPTLFNSEANDPAEFDKRSDNKGPEPEGVAVHQFGDRTLAAIGLERAGGIMLFDVTNPNSPLFLQYIRTDSSAPEGLTFFELGGDLFLGVAYENTTNVEIFKVIPEPASIALMGLAAAGLLRRRR